ncbi:hypothetical protein Agub_g9076, partial [Astrephomene gubernaculifera]
VPISSTSRPHLSLSPRAPRIPQFPHPRTSPSQHPLLLRPRPQPHHLNQHHTRLPAAPSTTTKVDVATSAPSSTHTNVVDPNDMASVPPPASLTPAPGSGTAPSQGAESGAQPFNWTSHWWPLLPEAYLRPERPNPVQLLGLSLVVWRDGAGSWRVFRDQC